MSDVSSLILKALTSRSITKTKTMWLIVSKSCVHCIILLSLFIPPVTLLYFWRPMSSHTFLTLFSNVRRAVSSAVTILGLDFHY